MNAYTRTPYEKESVELRMGTLAVGGGGEHYYEQSSGSDGIPVELFKILKDNAANKVCTQNAS